MRHSRARDFVSGGGFAEAGDVGVFANFRMRLAQWIVGRRARRDRCCAIFCDVVVGQLAVDAVDERAEFARVDEERLFAAVAELRVCRSLPALFFARNQRQTGI